MRAKYQAGFYERNGNTCERNADVNKRNLTPFIRKMLRTICRAYCLSINTQREDGS